MIGDIKQYIEDVTQLRFGAMYLGYKNYRFGENSEAICNFWQNHLIHKDGLTFPIFKVIDNEIYSYNIYQTRNMFTSW